MAINLGILYIYSNIKEGYFWFRLFGYGLHFKNTKKNALLFSERVLGHGCQIKSWRVKLLVKDKY